MTSIKTQRIACKLYNRGLICTFVKTASFYINVRSAMITILPQCAKYNLNLLHILKLTDFLQNVLLKKPYLFTGLSLLYQLGISPIKVGNVKKSLQRYPNPELASDLIQGFQYGFKLQYSGPRLPIEFKSMGLVGEMALIAREKINKWEHKYDVY
jgi:hypothetical protein